jgi:hypothetical protein
MAGVTLTIYGIAKETGMDYPFVARVVSKMGLKPCGIGVRGTDEYSLVEFTAALQEYKDRQKKEEGDTSQGQSTRSLEDIRLEEIIRGLKLKNDELEKKLVSTEYVKDYLMDYRLYLLTQLKDVLTNRFPNQGDGQKAMKLRSLGKRYYNDLLITCNKQTELWFKTHNLAKAELKEPEDDRPEFSI